MSVRVEGRLLPSQRGTHASASLTICPSTHPSLRPSIASSISTAPLPHFYMHWRGYGQRRQAVNGSWRKRERKKEHSQKYSLEWRGVVEKMTQTGWTGQSAMARGNDRKSANRIERVFLSPAVPNLAWLSLSVAMGGWCLEMVSVNAECLCHFWGWLFIKQTQTVRNQRGKWQSRRYHADGWCSSLLWCDLTAKVHGWRWNRSTSAVYIARCCRTKWQFSISCRFTKHDENICFVYLLKHQENSVMLASTTVVLSQVST